MLVRGGGDRNAESDPKSNNSESIINFASDLASTAFRQGLREAFIKLKQQSRNRNRDVQQRSYIPFSPIDLTMAQTIGILCISWLIAAVLRYAFLIDGKLVIRAPNPPKPFFPLNSSVHDFYRGDGADYAEVYNQADLTVLMFYAPWSLHSIEARKQFIRLARSFRGHDEIRFIAVNCNVGKCKRAFKLYSFPVILALTPTNTAILYEDLPTAELMFSWIVKLLSPVHRVDSIDDPLITSDKFDRILLAYFSLQNAEVTRSFRVYQLAAMKNRERVLFAVTLDNFVADHYGLNESEFKVLGSEDTYEFNENVTSANLLDLLHGHLASDRYSLVQWIRREADDDGGKSIRLHSMLNESRALLILVTTPFGRFQTSTSVEQMRQVARFYNDCSSDEEEYSSVRNWAQEIVDESGVACEFQPNMTDNCCNTMWHDHFCGKDQDLQKLEYTEQCSVVLRIFGRDRLHRHCCTKQRQNSNLLLSFQQQMACQYLRLFNSSNSLPSFAQLHQPDDLLSRGLICRSNRTVQFVAMDRRYSGHFLRSWNLNLTTSDDQLALISLDDDTVYSRMLSAKDGIKEIDAFLVGYAERTLEPMVFDERKRGSLFSVVQSDVDIGEMDEPASIERLTSESFRNKILNDTNRSYSAVVFFSGGNWHGQSMAVTHILHTVRQEFSAFDTLIRFFIIDTSRNSLPWAYVFDSLPAIMFFPGRPFQMTQSAHFPQDLIFTVPNLMAFLLARAQPELRFRVALRSCSHICLDNNRQRVKQFEDAVKADIRLLRLTRRRYTHTLGANYVTSVLRRRKLQLKSAHYLSNVLQILHEHQSADLQLSSYNETLIVKDSLLLRWLLANNFGGSFNPSHSFKL